MPLTISAAVVEVAVLTGMGSHHLGRAGQPANFSVTTALFLFHFTAGETLVMSLSDFLKSHS